LACIWGGKPIGWMFGFVRSQLLVITEEKGIAFYNHTSYLYAHYHSYSFSVSVHILL
jgi:hypothetical protein